MRRSRRLLASAVASCLLGGATTVALAWWLMGHTKPVLGGGPEVIRFPSKEHIGIVAHHVESPGALDLDVQTGMIVRQGGNYDAADGAAEAAVPEWARDDLVPNGWDGAWQPGMHSYRHLCARGWPWPAFAVVYEAQADTPSGPAGWKVVAGIDRSSGPRNPFDPTLPDALPTVPLWGPVAADTSLASVVWFGALVLSTEVIRRWRRHRRWRAGLCPDCAYDRGGLDPATPCPECGSPGS